MMIDRYKLNQELLENSKYLNWKENLSPDVRQYFDNFRKLGFNVCFFFGIFDLIFLSKKIIML